MKKKKIDTIDGAKSSVKKIWRIDRTIFPIFSVGLLIAMFIFLVVRYRVNNPYHTALIVQSDIARLADILHSIDAECSILEVKYESTPIDFLTVEKFVGSEIGGLNLAYPSKWEGPYLHDNPDINGDVYQIVRGKDGYFILPPNGFKMPSGLIVGTDIVITPNVEVAPLLKEGGVLSLKDIAFGIKLPFIIGDFPSESKPEKTEKNSVSETLEEFGKAMSYTEGSKDVRSSVKI